MHVSSAIHHFDVTFGLKEDLVKGEALPWPTFALPWILPLEYLTKTTTSMVALQVMQMLHAK